MDCGLRKKRAESEMRNKSPQSLEAEMSTEAVGQMTFAASRKCDSVGPQKRRNENHRISAGCAIDATMI